MPGSAIVRGLRHCASTLRLIPSPFAWQLLMPAPAWARLRARLTRTRAQHVLMNIRMNGVAVNPPDQRFVSRIQLAHTQGSAADVIKAAMVEWSQHAATEAAQGECNVVPLCRLMSLRQRVACYRRFCPAAPQQPFHQESETHAKFMLTLGLVASCCTAAGAGIMTNCVLRRLTSS